MRIATRDDYQTSNSGSNVECGYVMKKCNLHGVNFRKRRKGLGFFCPVCVGNLCKKIKN